MQFYDFQHEDFQRIIVESVKSGRLPQAALERAVKGVLRIKFLLGLFDNPYTDETLINKTLHTVENQTLALDAARQSIVLLKNENGLLPFNSTNPDSKRTKRITLTGTLANSTYVGGYSPAGAKAVSLYEALRKKTNQNTNNRELELDYISCEVSDRFSQIQPAFLSPEGNETGNGLKVEFFNNRDLSGEPAYTGIDANLNPYWHNLSPAPGINPESFSACWSGYLTVPATGVYEWDFRAANYGRIRINQQVLFDHWNEEWKNRGEKNQIRLEAGKKIPFRVEFAKSDGNAGMWLKWRLTNVENSTLYTDITRSAAQSDVVVVVMGEAQEEVGESRDKHQLNPHNMDMEILKAAVKSGKPVVTVMITGRPLILTEVCALSSAVLQCWFPGEAAGMAISDVLFGDYNPSGKLTISFPKDQGQLPVYYSKKPSSHRNYIDGNGEPLFPFGYGLSYSRFEYKNLNILPENPAITDTVTVSLDVTNTSRQNGQEVVQLYVNDMVSSVATPEKELKGFAKVFIKAGETQTVTMTLKPEHFSLINREMKRTVEAGEFEIMAGASSSDIRLKQIINLHR
jgi:beta-glucosidase